MILDFDYVYKKYNLDITGILHIGGHYGNVILDYQKYDVSNIVLFEPLSNNFSILSENVKNFTGNIITHQVALGNDNKKVVMNVSDNEGQSSSILNPKVHLTAHPEVSFIGTEEVEMKKLDDYNYQDYNMMVIDVQGYELEVFKGGVKTLENINYIFCEVNRDEVYEGNASIEEIDDFLLDQGFERMEVEWYYSQVFGDAFYIRKNEKKKIMELTVNKSTLENFPSVYYVTLEESINRQKILEKEFELYGIFPIAIKSKRFCESNDNIQGEYVHQLNDGTKGCCVSHLKAIKDWYDNTDDDYGFFCEDDLSLETVKYWNFNWDKFITSLPEDAECVQLFTIRREYDTFEIRERYWDDWGATAYILTRDYANKIINNFIKENYYLLEVPNQEVMPLIENMLFGCLGKVYTAPLFVENIQFGSTFEGSDDDVKDGHKNNHLIARNLVLEHWRSKSNLEIYKNNQNEDLLTRFSLDTENPENNFALGLWYEKNGHTAPALSYFLRCAERSENKDLAYEALIRGSFCYERQGERDGSSRGMLFQAQAFRPDRPEAYFLLSRYAERRQWWQDCYINAHLALLYCNFDCQPLRTDVEYPGKYGLLFEKAVSGWWWGKTEESKNILMDLRKNYPLNEVYEQSVDENLKRIGVEIEIENNLKYNLSSIFDVNKHNTDKGDLGYIDNFYDEQFLKFKDSQINLLEIGVYNGGSIKLWKDYFDKGSKIYAADINYFEHLEGTYSIIGDMYSKEQSSKFADDYFDLIIDDGPHSFESFVILMQKYFSKIKKGGILIIEDIINSLWVEPLYDLSYSLGYSKCEIFDMTGKQKTTELLDRWSSGLYILKITK